MKTIALYQVDVFAERLFAGNPAAVCPLQDWLPDETLQNIAIENNLAETAFFVPDRHDDAALRADFHLRWFTPAVEMDLCGHATLATGWVLFHQLGWKKDAVSFRTLGGKLIVERRSDSLWLALPTRMPRPPKHIPAELEEGLGADVRTVFSAGNMFMVVLEKAEQVTRLSPDMDQLRRLVGKGIIVTAPGRRRDEDFVSRFFAPAWGVDEDPVTGSSHCLLVPYWAQQLGREELWAAQLSRRGGRLHCRLEGEQVWLSGPVTPYLKGEVTL